MNGISVSNIYTINDIESINSITNMCVINNILLCQLTKFQICSIYISKSVLMHKIFKNVIMMNSFSNYLYTVENNNHNYYLVKYKYENKNLKKYLIIKVGRNLNVMFLLS